MQQYFFETEEVRQLRHEVQSFTSSQSNLRRGIFAKHTDLEKRVTALEGIVDDLLHVILTMQNIHAKPTEEKVIIPVFGELMEVSK